MDTNRMRYFLSLAGTGSVTKAAELHHISPAAFSKAIRTFQEEVGNNLIMPCGRGIILTDYARSLVPEIQMIIAQIDSIKQNSHFQMLPCDKHLRIATFEVFATHFLSKTLREFFPEYKCEIHEAIPGKMEELVANRRVDMALTYNPIPNAGLDHLRIQEVENGCLWKLKPVGL